MRLKLFENEDAVAIEMTTILSTVKGESNYPIFCLKFNSSYYLSDIVNSRKRRVQCLFLLAPQNNRRSQKIKVFLTGLHVVNGAICNGHNTFI